jgi:basic endochitinase B
MKWLILLVSLVLSACLTDSDDDDSKSVKKATSVAAKSSVVVSTQKSTDSKSISVSSTGSQSSPSSIVAFSSYGGEPLELRPVSLVDVNPLGMLPDPGYASKGTLTLDKFVTKTKFGQVASGLRHKYGCPGAAFYKLDDFLEAAKAFPRFGAEGDDETRMREVMAFFANISHETTGGWAAQADTEKYAMGLCFVEEVDFEKIDCEDEEFEYECSEYTLEGSNWDPVEGKSYHGRGPMQLSWNYNYGQVGDDLGLDILANPELVSSDGVIAFKTALWFWMKPQFPKPSAHDVMVGAWKYTDTDVDYKREQGFGVTINIINGGIECGAGRPNTTGAEDRIGFYKQYLSNYGLEPLYPSRLDCLDQIDFRQH